MSKNQPPEKPYNAMQITVLLLRMENKLDDVVKGNAANAKSDKEWREKHEKANNEENLRIHKRISLQRNLAASFGVVGICVGFTIGAYEKITKLWPGG